MQRYEIMSEEKAKYGEKRTLREFYSSLPNAVHPKTDFINEVAVEAGVSTMTVRNWVVYGMRPLNKKHIEILARKTGIPAEEMWEER